MKVTLPDGTFYDLPQCSVEEARKALAQIGIPGIETAPAQTKDGGIVFLRPQGGEKA